MSAYSLVLGVAVFLLHLWGTHSFPNSLCPIPCLCQHTPLLNCSSLGLTKIPTSIPATAVSLNISSNALRSLAPLSFGHVNMKGLLHLWVGSNALENLSLILKERKSGTRTPSSGEEECTSWAPDLQLLSAERNHLKHLPKGLGCMKSLQILQLSFNQISEIGLTDLDNCSHVKELHLQHNSITSIHPDAFIDLKQLQVLDLSYNLLVTIPVPAYQSLRNLNALVDVSFNRWKCDCNLQMLKRWIGFDTEIGDASWQVVCASPPQHAGKDLLHLKDSELTCLTHEYSTSGQYHNLIVEEGMQISIPCRNYSKDVIQVHWWTPHGQVTDNQPELLIKDITEQHAGFYVCVSGVRWEQISVFDLHVYKKDSGSRLRREATIILDEGENIDMSRNGNVVREVRTQSEFALAVSLSVIITFILAFILGVVLRPLLEKLWRRIRSKRQSAPPPNSTEPQPYLNEGYCDIEDQGQDVRGGSGVTFGGITEVQDQAPYYVTVENDQADGSSESNTEAEGLYEIPENYKSSITPGKQHLEIENHRGRADSGSSSSSSLQEGEVNASVINGKKLPPSLSKDTSKPMEFEQIPDASEITQVRRSSSSSASSHSSQEVDFSREKMDLTEQKIDSPTIIVSVDNIQGAIPGFTAEPFSDWSTRLTERNVDDLDPELWNDSGESFSFTEGSERSSIRDLSSSALGTPLKEYDVWRQGKAESHEDKNFASVVDFDKPFDKEVLVDDVKQFELSDKVSSSSSSESGESEGGPNNYLVNPESELDILGESDTQNSDNAATLNGFNTYENITFNDRMPSAGILPRQETITLEPSDIHLTFTRGDSFDDGMLIDDFQINRDHVNISDKFVDVGLDTVPKVKRYLEFKPFKPHSETPFSPSSTKKNILSEMEVKTETNTDESSGDNISLSQTEVSSDRIQKVKQYIEFKLPEPHTPTLPSSPPLTRKDAMMEAKRYSSSSSSSSDDDDALLTTKDDNFLRTTGVSSDGVSKVKRYIAFKEFDSSPTLSVSSTKIKTTNEATTKSMQPITSPTDTSKNVKQHMHFKQHEQPSFSLPSSPTSSRKAFSVKTTKYKKQNDKSYYGSHDSLPLYHVHPAYRSSINRLNRGYDSDRSISSEDEDQIIEYPRKLEITLAPEMNRGSVTPNKNKDKVLNIDFDNSSSTTDVLEKKHSKGLMRLRELSARLFNRHESETDERKSPTGTDVGRARDVSINKQSKLTKGQAYENIILGQNLSLDHLPKVKRYISFSHSYPQAQLPSTSPTKGVVTHDFIATTESRRSSFSSEDDAKQTTEDKEFVRQVDRSYDGLPKVKRYIQFSLNESCSTTLPLNKESISPELVIQPKSRRSSMSSDDDIKPIKDNFFGKMGVSLDTVPNVKRYIQFSQPKPYSPTQTSSPISVKIPVEEASPSTSVTTDKKFDNTGNYFLGQTGLHAVPKVKRYIQFTQSKAYSPPVLSSSTNITPEVKTEAKIDRSTGHQDFLTQLETSPENIQKVKRYINFKQSEPHSSPSLTKKDAILNTRKFSSSSEDDSQLTTKEDNFFRKIGAASDEVSKVKRYITFKQSEPSSPPLSVSIPSTKTQKDSDTFFEKIGASYDGVQMVKQYLQFKETESHPNQIQSLSSTSTSAVVHPSKIETEFKESRRSSSSSEDDHKLTAEVDNVFEEKGESLDRVPRVKRYIQFTHTESPSPTQTTTILSSETVNVSMVAKETRTWSTSSEEDTFANKSNIIGESNKHLAEIPKVKRYIKFTQAKPYSSDMLPFSPSSTVQSMKVPEAEIRPPATIESSSSEHDVQKDNHFGQIGVSLDRVPRVKRYIQFTHPESQSTSAGSAERVEILGVNQDMRTSSTSSEEDVTLTAGQDNVFGHTGTSLDKIPKVKRYIQFANSEGEPPVQTKTNLSGEILGISGAVEETRSTSTSSEDDVIPSTHDNNVQRVESFDKIPKVKRYLKFKQSEPSQDPEQFPLQSTVKSIKVTKTESSTLVKGAQPCPKEDKIFGETEAHIDKIPRVKRYIQFTHQSSDKLKTTSAERVGISGTISETRRSSSSFEDDVTAATKEDYFVEHRGAPVDEIPKVKRYIQFTHNEPDSSAKLQLPFSSIQKVTASSTSAECDVQPSKENKTESITEITSSDNFDRLPRVKRYIQFTPAQKSTAVLAERVSKPGVAQETSSKYVKPSATNNSTAGKTDTSFADIPKVKRYIQFTQSKPFSSTMPSFITSNTVISIDKGEAQETKKYNTLFDVKPRKNDDNFFQEIGVSLDKIPKVKRHIALTKSELSSSTKLMKRDSTPITNADLETSWSRPLSELSPPYLKKKGSAVIIKTESESQTSDLNYKDNLSSNKQSVGHQVIDEPPMVPETPPPPLEQEDAKEYLRENSEVRQRQERRRLLQQRRREMDEFNIGSLSSMQQEGDKQDGSLADYGAPTLQTESTYSVSTRNTSKPTEGAEATVLRGLKTKSTLGSKSSVNSKNKEFLI